MTGIVQNSGEHKAQILAPKRINYPRISTNLFLHSDTGFRPFVALNSNQSAAEASLFFAHELAPFVAIIGSRGWGKSLLKTCTGNVWSTRTGLASHYYRASELAQTRTQIAWDGALFLDDMSDALQSPKVRQNVRLTLEKRVRSGMPTYLVFGDQDREITKSVLPFEQEWLVATVCTPDRLEREIIARELAVQMNLRLSDDLISVIAHRLGKGGCILAGALNRLQLESTIWLGDYSLFRALGLLMSTLSSQNGWDLREEIAEVVAETNSDLPNQNEFGVFLMKRLFQLHEKEIADYYSINCREVYAVNQMVENTYSEPELRVRIAAWRRLFLSQILSSHTN